MGKNPCSEKASEVLLEQFELILDHDKLIDEVGFLHPSQLAEMNGHLSVSLPLAANALQNFDEVLKNGTSNIENLQYDEAVFWYGNHKLAISVQAVPLLYNAARLAYMEARRNYKMQITMTNDIGLSNMESGGANCQHFSETDIQKHSRALLILSSDFGSIWNSRKMVLSRQRDLPSFLLELNFSALILSNSPKSEQAWSHSLRAFHRELTLLLLSLKFGSNRRWVIKKIAEKFDDLYAVIGKESELVKIIAEKSKMNYRAWNHRCWLTDYMSEGQVLVELDKSRKWAELHVADSCCFHYRRRLILLLLENCSKKDCEGGSHVHNCSSVALLKEELKWNVVLIHRYIGREALWVHRRFLSCYWMKYLTNQHALACPSELHPEVFPALDRFLEEEVELLHRCLHIPADGFEETEAQSHHAATYMLWISKQILLPEFRMEEKLHELGGLKAILVKKCPERSQIWERLLD